MADDDNELIAWARMTLHRDPTDAEIRKIREVIVTTIDEVVEAEEQPKRVVGD